MSLKVKEDTHIWESSEKRFGGKARDVMRSPGREPKWILSPSAVSDPGDCTSLLGCHFPPPLASANSCVYFHFTGNSPPFSFASLFLPSLSYNVGGPTDGVLYSDLDEVVSETPLG